MGKKKNNNYSLFSDNEKTGSSTDDVLEEVCPKLSYTQRLYGFGICAGIGTTYISQ
jgi:hypothetical protein